MKRLSLMVVILSLQSAFAGVVTFSSQASWQAATSGGLTTIDFEGIAAAGGFEFEPGLLLSGVSFTPSSSTNQFVVDTGYSSPGYDFGTGATFDWQQGSPSTTNLAFPGGIAAIGFDLGSLSLDGSSIGVTLSTGDVFSIVTPTTNTLQFFGVISTVPISSIVLTSSGDGVLDNVSFGGSAAPEPAGFLLLGSGLVLALLCRRKLPSER